METIRRYKEKTLLGKTDGGYIYLTAPSWDCGWYWGFGYIGNKHLHTHLSSICKEKGFYDGIKDYFGKSLKIRPSDLWTFAELVKTFYSLKEAAETLGGGGSHFAKNPAKDSIINKKEVDRINSEVLPVVFDEIYKILERNENNNNIFKKLVNLNLAGDTMKVVSFMNKNNIKTDDLEAIDGLKKRDVRIIHTYYWRDYHDNKKQK